MEQNDNEKGRKEKETNRDEALNITEWRKIRERQKNKTEKNNFKPQYLSISDIGQIILLLTKIRFKYYYCYY